jgi:hypothetical protein
VRIRATGAGLDRRAGFAGLASCGSVWACPVCSAKILATRQDELSRALGGWTAGGGRIALVTLTMRHRQGQALADLWDALSYAWQKVVGGRPWQRLAAAYGTPVPVRRAGKLSTDDRLPYVRVVETTQGANGWHVHAHVALFLPAGVTVDQVDDIGGTMYAAWSRALDRRGLATSREAFDCKLWTSRDVDVRLADYFAKMTYAPGDADRAAMELTRGDLKTARAGNRTPFRILSDVLAFGLVDDVALWHEWERASKGRRQLTWSAGLRSMLLDDDERSDEEVAAEELGTADDDLVELPAAGWRMVARNGLDDLLLDVAEDDDTGEALRRYLTARGVPFVEVSHSRGMQRNSVGA